MPSNWSKYWLLVACCGLAPWLAGCGKPSAGQSIDEAAQAEFERHLDLTFCEHKDGALKLDIVRPADAAGKKLPAVICLHSGRWCEGDRKDDFQQQWATMLARQGYVGVTLDTRLAPAHKFPAPIEDVKCAIRWLRAHADEYGIDADRVAISGNSSGAQIAALVATTGPSDGLDGTGGHADQSSRVQAAVCFYGGYDLVDGYAATNDGRVVWYARSKVRGLLVDYLGCACEDAPDAYRRASAAAFVSADDPPCLLIQGTADQIIPVNQTEDFDKRLHTAGVASETMLVPDAQHGFMTIDNAAVKERVLAFLAKHLGAAK